MNKFWYFWQKCYR